MSVLRFVLMAATILFCATTNQSQAREMVVLSYQEMLEKSDLVVIATPKSKTTDTGEQAFLPNIWLQDKDGRQSKIESIGVETVFAVSVVFKGDKTAKQFTLHHYREAKIRPALDEASLVFLTHQTYRSVVPICFFLFANRMVASRQLAARLIPAIRQSARFHLNRTRQAFTPGAGPSQERMLFRVQGFPLTSTRTYFPVSATQARAALVQKHRD
jgi:hypothetical protein